MAVNKLQSQQFEYLTLSTAREKLQILWVVPLARYLREDSIRSDNLSVTFWALSSLCSSQLWQPEFTHATKACHLYLKIPVVTFSCYYPTRITSLKTDFLHPPLKTTTTTPLWLFCFPRIQQQNVLIHS